MLDLTVLILTYNERENIGRTLEAVRWADRVLIVDSYSTDDTLQIAGGFPNVQVVQRPFESFASQCNFGLEQIGTEWVLSIDADYVLTSELIGEIRGLTDDAATAGYSAEFYYNVHGRRLRSTLYPARTVLYRRRAAGYRDEGHGHRVTITGNVRPLSGRIDHDDRKPLSRWIRAQDRYSIVEAKHLLERQKEEVGSGASKDALPFQDRLRLKIYFAPVVMLFYLLIGRGLILDGWQGWYYVAQRTIAELLLSLRLLTERQKLEVGSRKSEVGRADDTGRSKGDVEKSATADRSSGGSEVRGPTSEVGQEEQQR